MRFKEHGNDKVWMEVQPTLQGLFDFLVTIYDDCVFHVLQPQSINEVEVQFYSFKRTREGIKNTYIVTVRGRGVGYTDGPLLDFQI